MDKVQNLSNLESYRSRSQANLKIIVAPCSSYVNWRFDVKYHLHLQVRQSAERETSVQLDFSWLRTRNWCPYQLIFDPEDESDKFLRNVFHILTTLRYMPEDGNIHNYSGENLIS
jgi:hypothetical protein